MIKPRKLIGIPGYDIKDLGFGAGLNHLEFISEFGDPIIIMPHQEFVKVDMLYLPGGMDINPTSYGQVPRFQTSNQDVFKQFFFDKRLKNYAYSTPIFGVCLGFQMLNVFFEGTLTQHIKFHPESKERWKGGHWVKTNEKETFEVNSHHHQAVKESDLSPQLDCIAYIDDPKEGKIIEAIKHKSLPIAGVQWHPEEFYDKYSSNLIKSLLKID